LRKIFPIVEGEGEIEAVPKLIVKILHHLGRYDFVSVAGRNARGCDNLKKREFLERLIRAAEELDGVAAVLIVVDADDNCPKVLAAELSQTVREIGVRVAVAVVVANREYEAWFLASLATIAGQNLTGGSVLPADCKFVGDVEAKSGVKEWITAQLPKGFSYKPRTDQGVLTQKIDVELAVQNSRSFRRLVHAIELLVDAADTNAATVSP